MDRGAGGLIMMMMIMITLLLCQNLQESNYAPLIADTTT